MVDLVKDSIIKNTYIYDDIICKNNCLDVCVEYSSKASEYMNKEK